jgi:tetratricopeptide (TPR) repeat protein
MSRVFICYRRADSAPWANKLYNHLSMRFGKDLIFQDVDDIKPGSLWLESISEELKLCRVFLILIGSYWLVDAQGSRRIDNPKDVLRMEVEKALSNSGTVIPILVGGGKMPLQEALPDALKPLTRYQAIKLREDKWVPDIESLVERLRGIILPTTDEIPLSSAESELYNMQQQYFDLLDKNAAEALELAQKTQAYLDRVFPLYPQESYLKVTRGYIYKNEAMALKRLRRYDEAETALTKGEIVFDTMITESPRDASAWNGWGSIAAVRGHYEEALRYINRALEIQPNYPEAIHDRQLVLKILATKSK